jgi:CBS domain-containing protein
MAIGFYCNREVVITGPETTVFEAALLMRTHHVGTLIVAEKADALTRPIGIITDRDLVLGVMAPGLDPETILVSDIMNEQLFTVREEESTVETIRIMRGHGIRRIPVVDRQGTLQGIVSLDDLVVLLAEELDELSKLIAHQKSREIKSRR